MFLRRVISLALIFSILSLPALAAEVEDHAPIGVMADHMHKKGEWMTSFRYMRMDMPQNYTGVKKQSVAEVHNDYMIAPIEMSMDMYMVGIMHGVTDEITAMLMIPYTIKKMSHRRRTDSAQFKTTSRGLGDIRLSGLFSLKEVVNKPVHLNFGISFPSGSIDETDGTLLGSDRNLPYPMQLGSGTYAVLPGITYIDKNEKWSWGAQHASTIQLGKNTRKYKVGDQHEMTSWIAYSWDHWISTSFRVKASMWGNINGADQRLNPSMVPTADGDIRGGERIDLFLGVNLLGGHGEGRHHRLAFEVGHPVYQSLDGPQLGVGTQATIGWQTSW